jgi:hypothetical protein
MMRLALPLAATLLLNAPGWATPNAGGPDFTQIHTGTLGPGLPGFELTLPMQGRGTASFRVETDRSVQFDLYDYGEVRYNFICSHGGDCGGNEIFFNSQYGPFVSNDLVQSKLVWRNAYRDGEKQYSLGYGLHHFVFSVPDGQPLTYRITHSFNNQVPEPAAWLLLVAGFGLTGMALRKQTRSGPAGA